METDLNQKLVDKITSMKELKPGRVYWVFIEEGSFEDVNTIQEILNEKFDGYQFIVSSDMLHVKSFDEIVSCDE